MRKLTLLRASLLIPMLLVPGFASDRYLVRTGPNNVNNILSKYWSYGVNLANSMAGSGQGLFVMNLPDGLFGTLVAQIMQMDPLIQGIEHDDSLNLPVTSAASVPKSSLPPLPPSTQTKGYSYYFGTPVWNAYLGQPAAAIIRVNDAHRVATGAGIVATIDSGADFTHPALVGSLIPGYDFTRNIAGGSESADLNQDTTPILDQDTTPILDNASTIVLNQDTTPILDQDTTPILDQRLPVGFGHGTMVAGFIHLVAPTAKIMPVKAFGSDGTSTVSAIVSAIYWAVDHGADVINMSFSTPSSSQELRNAITYANSRGVVCVASAGNGGGNLQVFPAAYNQVIGVGSTSDTDARSSFSNYGIDVAIGAPGEGVITTYPRNHYATGWGTSFSTAFVSGAAALLQQISRNDNGQQTMKALSHAAPVNPALGAGRLDLMQACNAARGN
jgi:subtilisin family serine protease